MYGRLEDVSALDFLRVQLDTGFRKRWDTSASELLVIEENSQLNYDIIYWEMQWPVKSCYYLFNDPNNFLDLKFFFPILRNRLLNETMSS